MGIDRISRIKGDWKQTSFRFHPAYPVYPRLHLLLAPELFLVSRGEILSSLLMLHTCTLRAQAEPLAQSRICIQLRSRDTNRADPFAVRVAHVQNFLRPLASFAFE